VIKERHAPTGYWPALDGFRGIAVVLVVAFNLELGLPAGYVGVDMFFVLSGFLITALLLREHDSAQRINLGAFYVRRALRLIPALLILTLLLCGAATLLHPPELARHYYIGSLAALFFVGNWIMALDPANGSLVMGPLAPTWSLGVEEQFYLVWPLVLGWMLAHRVRIGGVVISGIVASAAWRVWLSYEGVHPWRIYCATDTRADALLIGCLLAVLLARSDIAHRVSGRALSVASWGALTALLLHAI